MHVNHIVNAMITQPARNSDILKTDKLLEKHSIGLRVNRASDDATSLSVPN